MPQKSVCLACSLVSYITSLEEGTGVFVTGTDSPVNMDSLRMQLPVSSTASQGIRHPWDGITKMSPGTNRSVGTVAVCPVARFRITVATSDECIVARRFC